MVGGGGGGGRRSGQSTEKQAEDQKGGEPNSLLVRVSERSQGSLRTHPASSPCHHYFQKMRETQLKCFLGLCCREQQREVLSLRNTHTCTDTQTHTDTQQMSGAPTHPEYQGVGGWSCWMSWGLSFLSFPQLTVMGTKTDWASVFLSLLFYCINNSVYYNLNNTFMAKKKIQLSKRKNN